MAKYQIIIDIKGGIIQDVLLNFEGAQVLIIDRDDEAEEPVSLSGILPVVVGRPAGEYENEPELFQELVNEGF